MKFRIFILFYLRIGARRSLTGRRILTTNDIQMLVSTGLRNGEMPLAIECGPPLKAACDSRCGSKQVDTER